MPKCIVCNKTASNLHKLPDGTHACEGPCTERAADLECERIGCEPNEGCEWCHGPWAPAAYDGQYQR